MRPATSINDAADVAPVESKVVSNRLVGFAIRRAFTNSAHKIIVQHGGMMILALLLSVSAHVGIVRIRSAPRQVAKPIVAGVTIGVETFHSIGTGTNKSQQYQFVELKAARFPARSANANNLTPVFIVGSGFKSSPSIATAPFVVPLRPYASVVTDSITIEAGNVFVSCHASILSQMDREAIAL